MTTTHANVLVLKDQSGTYFLLPEDLLEQGRVPAEQTAEVAQLVSDADVSGHFLVNYLIYRMVREAVEGVPLGPVLQRVLEENR